MIGNSRSAINNVIKSTLFDINAWQHLADQLVTDLRLHVCHILLINQETMGARFHISSGERVPTELIEVYLQQHVHNDALLQLALNAPAVRFYTISEQENRDEIYESDHFKMWAKPQGLLDSATACLMDEGNWKVLMLLNRHEREGDFDSDELEHLNSLYPDLAEAAELSFSVKDPFADRLRLSAVVETFRIPVAVLTEQGIVCAVNREMDQLINTTKSVSIEENCLALTDKSLEQELYNNLILNAKKVEGYDVEPEDFIAVEGDVFFGFQPLMSGPTTGEQHFQGIMVFALASHLIKPISEQRLSTLFSLSPKEAAITALLAKGKSVKEIAESQFVSVNTVKFHLKNIFQKTGCSSQMLIMNLVNSIPFAD